jgi:alpha-tubulin suppressor-like RCC1 family protein
MDFIAGAFTTGSRRRGLALIVLAALAALTMAFAAPAQATPNLAKAWGLNKQGQLGDGTTTGPEHCGPEREACSTTPVEVSGLTGVAALAGGPSSFSHFSLALLEAGTVMAWGVNGSGQLGNGTTVSSDVPVPVCAAGPKSPCPTGPFLSGVTAISAGEEHGLALVSNRTVKAWGVGSLGQLGNGTTVSSDVPVEVTGLRGVVAVSAGGEHSLALLENGTVMAWGNNSFGQLGNGTNTASDVPVAVSRLSGVVAISAGYRHSLALLSNGTVMAWGNNPSGQLGNGTNTASDVPVAVSGMSGVVAISAGGEHSLALLTNGTVKAWGANKEGQLGIGTSAGPEACGLAGACSKTPVPVCAGTTAGPCPSGPVF